MMGFYVLKVGEDVVLIRNLLSYALFFYMYLYRE